MVTLIDPVPRINQYLKTYLESDPTLMGLVPNGVWRGRAPQNTETPYVIFTFMAPIDRVMGNGQFISLWRLKYVVKVVITGNSLTPGQSASDRLVQLLHTARGGVGGLEVVSVDWDAPINYEETGQLQGAQSVIGTFQHMGGEYTISVRPTD